MTRREPETAAHLPLPRGRLGADALPLGGRAAFRVSVGRDRLDLPGALLIPLSPALSGVGCGEKLRK